MKKVFCFFFFKKRRLFLPATCLAFVGFSGERVKQKNFIHSNPAHPQETRHREPSVAIPARPLAVAGLPPRPTAVLSKSR
jgi:hypothetical protein